MERDAVLVVDDEEVVRRIARKFLESLGFFVFEASGGSQAIDLYAQQQTRIAVVVLDLLMPGMDGADTLAELKRIDPKVRVLMSFGGVDRGNAQSLGVAGVLKKPYLLHEFASAIDGVLKQP